MTFAELHNKHIAILGLGVEGVAMANYLLDHDIAFSVLDEKTKEQLLEVSALSDDWKKIIARLDEKGIETIFGERITSSSLVPFDIVIRSPGISLHTDYIQDFLHQGGEVYSVTKLFFDNCPGKIIGVTGTKGKGTTSSLIYEMLKKAGRDAYLGGNIGQPPITFLDSLTKDSVVVLELSSFQLQDVEKSPHIAVMLMVTSEHLDYHKDTAEYVEAKRNIVRFQTSDDMAILNNDYPSSKDTQHAAKGKVVFVSRFTDVEEGCFVRNNDVILRIGEEEKRIIDISDILLPGAHNLENVCAAIMAAFAAGVDIADIAFVLRTFKGLEHRLELVRDVKGVRYYDDSFSTVPETAIAAIQAFQAPEIVILGGSSKNSDFTQLGKILTETSNIKAIIGIGVEWKRIQEAAPELKTKVVQGCKTMEDIVHKASSFAQKGDVVILSPACASFDMFKNYKDRGNQFKEQVNLL